MNREDSMKLTRLSRPSSRLTRPGGFTLTEMLIVVGIIAVLLSIGLPVLFSIRRSAERGRSRADMAAIETALATYKQDLGDYPRPNTFPADDLTFGNDVLGACLIADSGRTVTSPIDQSAGFPYDNQAGPGFKLSATSGGRVYGPYLQNNYQIVDLGPNQWRTALLDRNGSRILYFPARNPHKSANSPKGYVADKDLTKTASDGSPIDPLYDHKMAYGSDGTEFLNLYLMRFALGDTNMNGQIDDGTAEQAIFVGDYILWMAGPDKRFVFDPGDVGVSLPASSPDNPPNLSADQISKLRAAWSKCDDVTNFRP